MGSWTDSMQTLVDEITASTQSRRNRLQELGDETKDALERFGLERQDTAQALDEQFAANRAQRSSAEQARLEAARGLMDEIKRAHKERAQALSEHLAAEERARLEAARGLMDEIKRVGDQRRTTISELRSDAHNLIERFGLQHQDMAQALRDRLSSEDKALKESVKEMVDELASDIGQAHQIWTEGLKKKMTSEVVVAVEEVVPEEEVIEEPVEEEAAEVAEEEPAVEAAPPLSDQVLEVVARHPDGIKLVDIGNELGVDWRLLIGPSKSLVDTGRIEKVEALYYPRGGSLEGEDREV